MDATLWASIITTSIVTFGGLIGLLVKHHLAGIEAERQMSADEREAALESLKAERAAAEKQRQADREALAAERAQAAAALEAYRLLMEKMMDGAVPTLRDNAAATKAMMDVTKTLSDRLLVWQDRESRGGQ